MRNDKDILSNNKSAQSNLSGTINYQNKSKWLKFKRKINTIFVNKIEGTSLQFKLYRSYWHHWFNKTSKPSADVKATHYLCLTPNYGAGIGHQLANWNTGLYFARYFNLRFAHSPFSNRDWEFFFGFGEGEVLAEELKQEGYQVVRLPRFDSTKAEEVELIGEIINSYVQEKILFCMEADQGYMDQYETSAELSRKFFAASSRLKDKIIFDPGHLNIAVHIRRPASTERDENLSSRWMGNEYYINILSALLDCLPSEREFSIYLFAQGTTEDFLEFNSFKNINYCLDMGPVDSFLHMTLADILISSKSSFSYKPALISKGIKICPESFWHGYPTTEDYILADDNGKFDRDCIYRELRKQKGIN